MPKYVAWCDHCLEWTVHEWVDESMYTWEREWVSRCSECEQYTPSDEIQPIGDEDDVS